LAFTGIPIAALDFYEDLEADNSKAFWLAHKHIYDESVRAPLDALIAELEPDFGPAKLFRPYRDVRFAKDKTPYKTQQGAWFGQSSTYVAVSAEGLFVAGGYWQTGPEQVARLRRAVDDDVAGPQLTRAIAAIEKAHFELSGEQVTRVPNGYPKDHPRGELLRYKSMTAHRQFGAPAWLTTKRAKSEIVKAWRAMDPLTGWLHTHVGRD
jgi:uncharacterized protein (TIGR02453 family)